MEIENVLNGKKEIQQNLLTFLDGEEENQNIEMIFQYANLDDVYELHEILLLISKISNNHHHSPNFIDKIESVIDFLKEKINGKLSNSQIFHLFKRNKRILLFLFEKQIIKADKLIVQIMLTEKYKSEKYPNYFFKEIRFCYVCKSIQSKFIIQLIREDSIDDFVMYVNRFNLNLSSKISTDTISETNSYLIKNVPTLIEYSAFCGSIQIFKYLYLNNVKVTSSLWPFTIHGRNAELIHFLEENNVKPKDKFYQCCINESIKCHHNEIVEYLENTLLKKNKAKNLLISYYSIKYCNYKYFPNYLVDQSNFFNLCKYNHILIVKFLLLNGNIELNSIKI